MGFRFRRRIRLGRGIWLNASKSGTSLSAGGHGATVNFGKNGATTTLGIPGTGLSYRSTIPQEGETVGQQRQHAKVSLWFRLVLLVWVGAVAAMAIAAAMSRQ